MSIAATKQLLAAVIMGCDGSTALKPEKEVGGATLLPHAWAYIQTLNCREVKRDSPRSESWVAEADNLKASVDTTVENPNEVSALSAYTAHPHDDPPMAPKMCPVPGCRATYFHVPTFDTEQQVWRRQCKKGRLRHRHILQYRQGEWRPEEHLMNGRWVGMTCGELRGTISGTTLKWPSGKESTLEIVSSREIRMMHLCKVRSALLHQDTMLHWDDSDVWRLDNVAESSVADKLRQKAGVHEADVEEV